MARHNTTKGIFLRRLLHGQQVPHRPWGVIPLPVMLEKANGSFNDLLLHNLSRAQQHTIPRCFWDFPLGYMLLPPTYRVRSPVLYRFIDSRKAVFPWSRPFPPPSPQPRMGSRRQVTTVPRLSACPVPPPSSHDLALFPGTGTGHDRWGPCAWLPVVVVSGQAFCRRQLGRAYRAFVSGTTSFNFIIAAREPCRGLNARG